MRRRYSLITLRRANAARYRIRTREETTTLIYYSLRRNSESQQAAGQFRDLLAACDLVKFAKHRPDDAASLQSVDWARKVVLNSRRVAQAATPTVVVDKPLEGSQ